MKTIIIGFLVICCLTMGCSRMQEIPPVQTLLDTFAEAAANQSTETMIGLFLPPDETPAGLNRKHHIDEIEKDWPNVPPSMSMTVSFMNVSFDNESLLKADMVVANAKDGKQTIPVRFKVRLSKNEWKIVSMDYVQ